MKLSLTPIAFAMMLVASVASAEKKSSAPKVRLCESTDLYFGTVDASTSHVRVSEVCKQVSSKTAIKKVQACAAETPETCEVLVSQDQKTIMIEHKVTSTGEKK